MKSHSTYKTFPALSFLILIMLLISIPCYSNSVEPPSIIIIVPGAPEELEISITLDNEISEGLKSGNVFESHYKFYSLFLEEENSYIVTVNTGSKIFTVELDSLKAYNNYFTLDLEKHTLIAGKIQYLSVLFISQRIIFTLIIEAIIFQLFGFREKKSWIVFFITNIITQGLLNIWLSGFDQFDRYLGLILIFGEFFVLLAEIWAFAAFIEEKRKTFLYVLTANFASLILGGYLITMLPI